MALFQMQILQDIVAVQETIAKSGNKDLWVIPS
jgi:hypothetical protein